MEKEQRAKVIVVGDTSVGKSNILSRYINNEFGRCDTTIGCESMVKIQEVNDRKIKLLVWDTAGQERYKSISQAYYKGAAAVILVYDITNLESFEHLAKWHEELIANSQPQIIKLVVGNKVDLDGNRKVRREDGEQFAKDRGTEFMQVSAATGANINEIFEYIALKFSERTEGEVGEPTEKIKLKPKNSKKVEREQNPARKWC